MQARGTGEWRPSSARTQTTISSDTNTDDEIFAWVIDGSVATDTGEHFVRGLAGNDRLYGRGDGDLIRQTSADIEASRLRDMEAMIRA